MQIRVKFLWRIFGHKNITQLLNKDWNPSNIKHRDQCELYIHLSKTNENKKVHSFPAHFFQFRVMGGWSLVTQPRVHGGNQPWTGHVTLTQWGKFFSHRCWMKWHYLRTCCTLKHPRSLWWSNQKEVVKGLRSYQILPGSLSAAGPGPVRQPLAKYTEAKGGCFLCAWTMMYHWALFPWIAVLCW